MFKTELRIGKKSIVDRMKALIKVRQKDEPTFSQQKWLNEAVENEIEREEKIIQKHN